MAAILQLRQGSTSTYISQGPNIAEPFFDTGSNILVVGKSASEVIKLTKLDESNAGSFSITGDYTGSNLYLSGDLTASNVNLSGDITIGGNIILGDAVQDSITISGQFDSDLIPSASATYDLGSTTKKWNHLYALSASIDSVDLVANLPSGVVSSSAQISLLGYDNYGGWYARGDNNNDLFISSYQRLYFTGRNGIITETLAPGNEYVYFDLDTGSVHFTDAVAGVGAPAGTISGSQQVIDLLPSGVISGSTQLPNGLVSGSSQVVESLPTNTVSGSVQVLGGTSIVSSSVQVVSFLPSGTVSGSSQVVDVLTQVNSFTSSQDTKNTTLATYTGSVDTSISSLNSFTNSFDTAISLNSSDVTILGNLTVQGTQTQLNTSTLNVEDKNILLASGAADSSAANGAGITIDGANKSLQWEHSTTQFVFDAQVSSSVGFKGDGSNLTGLTADSVEYDNILNKPTLVSGSDQILGGSDIVSSSTQVTNFLPSGTISGSTQVLGGTSIVSSSNQVITYLPSGTVSGSTQIIEVLEVQTPGLVSGSDQVTASLDSRYATLGGNNLLSSSNENFSDYSQSVDTRLLNTLSSGSATSQSLYTLVGNFPTSGSLGTSAFYNVSSSLADDPNTIPNVKAVYDYINNVVQAADITGVSASFGLSGGGDAGYVSLSLDTSSQHFINGVQAQQSYYGGWYADATNGLNQHISSGEKLYFRGDTTTNDISTTITQLLGVNYIEFQINTGSSHFSNAVAAIGAPAGTVSGSQQVIDFLPSGVISGSDQLPSGIISGSAISTDGTDLVAIGTSVGNVADLGSGNQLSLYNSGLSGILSFDDSGTVKSYDYVSSNVRYVDTNSGVSIAIKPDATATKAWVFDTDGDLVSNGGSWNSGNLYSSNVIARNAVTASNMLVDFNITADTFIGTIAADNGVISGSSQVISSLPSGVVSGSSQITITESQISDLSHTDISNLNTFTGSFNSAISLNSSDVTILGNLTVQGDTTQLNTATLNVEDLNITLASGSASSAAANGAGITVDGASATLTYASTGDKWVFNKVVDVPTSGILINGTAVTSTAAELNQLDGVTVGGTTAGDIVTIDATQTLTNKTISAAQVTEISNLTADEGAQLENIGTTTISATQWGYLGSSNQGIATGDDVTFNTVSATGDIVAYASSDRRLKDEIQPISDPISKINSIGGYSFVWNTEKQNIYNGKDYGVIAQEIEEILPELVQTRENGYKAVKYDKLVSLLIEGIKELSKEVQELKKKIN